LLAKKGRLGATILKFLNQMSEVGEHYSKSMAHSASVPENLANIYMEGKEEKKVCEIIKRPFLEMKSAKV